MCLMSINLGTYLYTLNKRLWNRFQIGIFELTGKKDQNIRVFSILVLDLAKLDELDWFI